MFLPRQFQIAVVENVDERHLQQGDLALSAVHAGDQRVRPADRVRRPAALPRRRRRRRHVRARRCRWHEGAVRARAARVHRRAVRRDRHGDRRDDRAVDDGVQRPRDAGAAASRTAALGRRTRPDRLLLGIRRGAIVLVLLLGYLYFRLAGEAYALVSIGLISFAAVAQFAPVMLGGMYLDARHARRRAGRARRGFRWYGSIRCCCRRSRNPAGCRSSFLEQGLFGIVAHCGRRRCSASPGSTRSRTPCSGACSPTSAAYVGVSLFTRAERERSGARPALRRRLRHARRAAGAQFWRGSASLDELQKLLRRFLGTARADEIFAAYARRRGWPAHVPLRGRRGARDIRRNPAGRRDRRRVRASDGRIGGAGGTALDRRRHARFSTRRRKPSPTAARSSRSRTSWRPPLRSCGRRTSG